MACCIILIQCAIGRQGQLTVHQGETPYLRYSILNRGCGHVDGCRKSPQRSTVTPRVWHVQIQSLDMHASQKLSQYTPV